MKKNDETCKEIKKSKIDICYFVKNIMSRDLLPYEEIILQKMIEAKENGGEFVFLGGRIHRKRPLQNISREYYHHGKKAHLYIFDEI